MWTVHRLYTGWWGRGECYHTESTTQVFAKLLANMQQVITQETGGVPTNVVSWIHVAYMLPAAVVDEYTLRGDIVVSETIHYNNAA